MIRISRAPVTRPGFASLMETALVFQDVPPRFFTVIQCNSPISLRSPFACHAGGREFESQYDHKSNGMTFQNLRTICAHVQGLKRTEKDCYGSTGLEMVEELYQAADI